MSVRDFLANLGKVEKVEHEKFLDFKCEHVMPDGRFATIYKKKVVHMVRAEDPSGLIVAVKMVAQLVRMDDKPLNVDDVLSLDVDDFLLLLNLVNK
jgi:hypothetical protein